ncbi:Glutamate-gated chloride channel, partial [Fragariocoptes setiger]
TNVETEAQAEAEPEAKQKAKWQNEPQKVTGFNREIEKQIVDRILGEGYDKRIRPSEKAAIVTVNTLIRSISEIDDVKMEYSVQLSLRQEWVDERLAFHRLQEYKNKNINSITLTEQERLWKPDLFFRNEKDGHFHKIIMPNVLLRINGDGSVLYSIRISLVLACPMDLKYYPLDKQNCTIEMASYGYLDEDLKFVWKEKSPVQISKPLTLPRFTLETFVTAYCTSRTTTGAYSCLRVDLIFKREFSYYLIQIYIPCCMLVIVSWVSFWLDPNAIPARVSLGVTTLLTMATQISGINASMPPVSYTKAIDVWTGVCLTFVFGALLEFALVNYASRSDAHSRMRQMQLQAQEESLKGWSNNNGPMRTNYFVPDEGVAEDPANYHMYTQRGNHVEQYRNSTGNDSAARKRACEIHVATPGARRKKNWLKAWLAKFPSKSKRIDVISRIFFPLKFALFNLVYWTTYLFREEETTP